MSNSSASAGLERPSTAAASPRPAERAWAPALHFSRALIPVAVLTLIAFALRRYHLGAESLWFDEADIVSRARQPLSTLAGGFAQAGENGPLYTIMLHYWLAVLDAFPTFERAMRLVFGSSFEAPVRALSALFGTAAIPLMYALGKRVGGYWLGIAGAALLTFNPFHIWYSQDVKMYAMLVFMTLASTWLYLTALERGTLLAWAGYVVTTWVLLTTHSMAGLVLLAQLVATPFMVRRMRRLPTSASPLTNDQSKIQNPESQINWVAWGWAMLLILGPLFPIVWLRGAALVTGTADVGGWYAPAGLFDIVGTTLVTFSVNRAGAPWEMLGAAVLGLLSLAGLWALFRGPRTRETESRPEPRAAGTELLRTPGSAFAPSRFPEARWLLPALWLIPIAALWLVTLKVPLFQARYLIMALPAYLLLVAAGLVWLFRLHPAAGIVPVVLAGLAGFAALSGVNYSPQAQKEDWRDAMSYVQDHARLRDVIVVFPGYLNTAANLYYHPGGPGRVPDIPIAAVPTLSTEGFGQRELQDALRAIVKCHERAWLVTSPPRQALEDPQNHVQQWFQFNWLTFDTQVFNGVTVYGISFNGQPDCWYPNADHYEPHTYENGIEFQGYIYELRDNSPTQPDASYFPLTLYWHTGPVPPKEDYLIRVRIQGPDGKVVKDETLGPLDGYWPTSHWPRNTKIIDYRDLRLPGGLAPGDYRVSIQMVPQAHPDRPVKLVGGGDEIVLKTPLKVVPWKP